MKITKAMMKDAGRMGGFYHELEVSLYCATFYSGEDDRATKKTGWGLSDYDSIIYAIINLNRAFLKLLEIKEPLAAFPLIRIQTDNLIYLYAEYLYPNQILYKVYDNERAFNQIKINGENLKQSEIVEKIEGIKPIWKKYSSFIHPSKEQHKYMFSNSIKKADLELALNDMYAVNVAIADTLTAILDRLEAIIKANGQYKAYKAYVQQTLYPFQ